MKSTLRLFAALLLTSVFLTSMSFAVTVPFTETFTGDVSNWANNAGSGYVDYAPSGGPDGSSYATTEFVTENQGGTDVVLFRGQDEFGSSGGAFEGNWIADGAGRFSAYVRQDTPVPLNFFTRFSGPSNFPGGVAVEFIPVLPNTWTKISFDILPNNPKFVTFEGMGYNAAFSNIGHIQVGISVPASLDTYTTSFTFDLDNVSVTSIPEPAGLMLMSMAMAGGATMLRNRNRQSTSGSTGD